MADYLKTAGKELSAQQKKIIRTIIRNAQAKAGDFGGFVAGQ